MPRYKKGETKEPKYWIGEIKETVPREVADSFCIGSIGLYVGQIKTSDNSLFSQILHRFYVE